MISTSSFTYPIARPYPYRWFKWVAILGAVILVVLISILNLANDGYTLVVEYTTSPNTTLARSPWAQKLVAVDNKNAARCQSQNLPVDTQYYTDKLSMPYTITNVWQRSETGPNLTMPSLRYTNNALENCSIGLIQLEYASMERTAAEIGWIGWSIDATAMVTCSITNEQNTFINLTMSYNFVPLTIESGNAFRFLHPPDEDTQTNLWWAESLLSFYWLNAVAKITDQHSSILSDGQSQAIVEKGTIAFRPSYNTTDLSSPDFYGIDTFHWIVRYLDENGYVYVGPPYIFSRPDDMHGAYDLIGKWPDVWRSADSFVKVLHSAIMTDLGQTLVKTVLNDPALLREWSAPITGWTNVDDPSSLIETPYLHAGPAREPYISDGNGGNLTVTPSGFYTQYLCEVPTMKSAGSLILSLLVADIVFLQAAWKILNWVTLKFLEQSDPTAHYCAGCLAAADGDTKALSVAAADRLHSASAKFRYKTIEDD